MKKCPFCSEEIKDEAIVCRYCRSELPGYEEEIKRRMMEAGRSVKDEGVKRPTQSVIPESPPQQEKHDDILPQIPIIEAMNKPTQIVDQESPPQHDKTDNIPTQAPNPYYRKTVIVALSVMGIMICAFFAFMYSLWNYMSPQKANSTANPIETYTSQTLEAYGNTAVANTEEFTTTPKPTQTLTPTSTIEPTPSIVTIVDVPSILGKPVNEVERVLGETLLITPNDDNDDDLAGGEYRDYQVGKYTVFVVYDKTGIARVFQVLDGMSDENYSITQWDKILLKFGMNMDSSPDRVAPAAIYWKNYNGYFIAIVASNISGRPVHTVQIAQSEFGQQQNIQW